MDNTTCEYTLAEKEEIMLSIQKQFAATYSQFDKNRNIDYQFNLEYEYVKSQPPNANDKTLIFRDVVKNEKGGFVGGETKANHPTIRLNTNASFEKRKTKDITRTAVHELGHNGGLNHPWEIQLGSFEEDAKQGIVPDLVVKKNIMNSGGNPDGKLMYNEGSGIDATKATNGQVFQMLHTIKIDYSSSNVMYDIINEIINFVIDLFDKGGTDSPYEGKSTPSY